MYLLFSFFVLISSTSTIPFVAVTTKQFISVAELFTHTPGPILDTSKEKKSCGSLLEPSTKSDFEIGYRFGTKLDSRLEFFGHNGCFGKNFSYSVNFKTTEPNGIIIFTSSSTFQSKFLSLHLVDGKVIHKFNLGTNTLSLVSQKPYNDGQWHAVEFSRVGSDNKLFVDNIQVAEGKVSCTSDLNDVFPYYVGGVTQSIKRQVKHILGIKKLSFVGCLKNFSLNKEQIEKPKLFKILACAETTELDTFFGAKGGYLKSRDLYNVGTKMDIKMSIKPRNTSGLLLTVNGRSDYVIIQMINGSIKFSTRNRRQSPFTLTFVPPTPNFYCDGQWHFIHATKSGHKLTLSVDGNYADAKTKGKARIHNKTRGILFVGGHRYIKRIKRLHVRNSFVGCIKGVCINNMLIPMSAVKAEGDITVGVCPTN